MQACWFGNNCRRHDCWYAHPDNRDNRPKCKFGERCRDYRGGSCVFKHLPQLTVAKTVIPYYGREEYPQPTVSHVIQLTPNDYFEATADEKKIDDEKELCPGGWHVEDGPYGPLGDRRSTFLKGNCKWCGGGKIKCEEANTEWTDYWRHRVKKLHIISLCEPCCTTIKRCKSGVWFRWE